MERVQYYASVDARKCLEPGVAGERYKSVSSVDTLKSKDLVMICHRGGYTHTYNLVSSMQ